MTQELEICIESQRLEKFVLSKRQIFSLETAWPYSFLWFAVVVGVGQGQP